MEESSPPFSWQDKYKLAKLKVKAWEGEYVAANGSRPDKAALTAAPDGIKAAYKTYVYYRKRIESLDSSNGCPNEKEGQENHEKEKTEETNPCHGKVAVDNIETHQQSKVENVKPEAAIENSVLKDKLSQDVDKLSCATATDLSKTINGTWGRHLNKDACIARVSSKSFISPGSLYSKMAENMRASGTVKMRTSLKKFSNIERSTKAIEKTHSSQDTVSGTSSIEKSHIDKENFQSADDFKCPVVPKPFEETTSITKGSLLHDKCIIQENLGKEEENINLPENSSTSVINTTEEMIERSTSATNLSIFDSLNQVEQSINPISTELNMFSNSGKKIPFKLQRKQTTQKIHSQAISALILTPDRLVDSSMPKKKGTLNRGWLARCTGSELEDVSSEASDDWKLKLTDKEWTEEDNHNDMDVNDYQRKKLEEPEIDYTSKKFSVTSIENNKDCNKPKPQHQAETSEVIANVVTSDYGRQRNQNEYSTTQDVYDFNDGLNERCGDEEAQAESSVKSEEKLRHLRKTNTNEMKNASPVQKRGRRKKLNADEPDRASSSAQKKRVNTEETDNALPLMQKEVISDCKTDENEQPKAKNNKRKRKETLEELEASGQIKSSWPPPKKVRNSRVKARKKLEELNVTEKVSEEPVADNSHNNILDYNELDDIEKNGIKAKPSNSISKEERFRKKVTSGAANNNFVRINLKKKTFVRGHKHMNGSKYRRMEWKKKQSLKSGGGDGISGGKSFTCFKCGEFGHWAKFCPGKKGDNLLSIEDYDENESTFLSLEDAAAMAQGIKPANQDSTTKIFPKVQEVCDENKDLLSVTQENGKVHDDIQTEAIGCSQVTDSQELDNILDDTQMDADDDLFADIDEDQLAEDSSQTTSFTSQKNYDQNSNIPEFTGNSQTYEQNQYESRPIIDPLYGLVDDEVGPTPQEVHDTLKMFGYPSFRTGQENAIMRILSGQSTLLVLSTGSGKSLCYQLPAYLYAKHNRCITLCVSPLVSLMEDQVTGLPSFLHAVCLHTHQNPTQRSNAVNAIRSGSAHILLISPEAVVASRSGGVLGTLLRELPPVAFACLDEAHCVSEWSHNFRPSYLRICQVLRDRLGVRTILGLTATARHSTAISIAKHLLIPKFNTGVIRGRGVPDNLRLSVSRDENREQALITLLQADRFSYCSSIIIYCTRRDECERIATLIRTQLINPTKVDVKNNLKRFKGISMDAEAYHAGLSSHRRQQVQKKFMSGKLRIVVATVAFGMGIDKSDVRGIIHFNMPRNVESYVQEIGRAGRDGEEAHCHLFLDAVDGKDIQELKRHIFANSMDRHTVRKLLNKIFKPCACAKVKNLQDSCDVTVNTECDRENADSNPAQTELPGNPSQLEDVPENRTQCASNPESFAITFSQSSCPKHEVCVPINDLVEELDLPSENIETLLCYLELNQGKLIHMNSPVYATCTVSCYAGPRQLVAVSRKCPPLGVAIAFERQKGTVLENKNRVVFPVVDIASRMGWNSRIVKRELKALEWNTHDLASGGKVKRSGVTVEFSDLSYHMDVRGDLSDDDRDQLLDSLYLRTQTQERDQLRQVQYIYQLLRSVSHGSVLLCSDSVDTERENKLREALREYFKEGSKVLYELRLEEQLYIRPEIEASVRGSVRALLSTHLDHQWTGRAVARVFHGIGSPNFPVEVWGRVRRFWRLHLTVNFNMVLKLATQEIIRYK